MITKITWIWTFLLVKKIICTCDLQVHRVVNHLCISLSKLMILQFRVSGDVTASRVKFWSKIGKQFNTKKLMVPFWIDILLYSYRWSRFDPLYDYSLGKWMNLRSDQRMPCEGNWVVSPRCWRNINLHGVYNCDSLLQFNDIEYKKSQTNRPIPLHCLVLLFLVNVVF